MAELVRTKAVLRERIAAARANGLVIGFVPTMGALHKGHISLIEASAASCGFTVVSIFVNPTQFGPQEDYQRYPRDLQGDLKLAEAARADLVYAPSVEEMYPKGFKTFVTVEGLSDLLCGAFRPGHFRGVATVVAKLLNQVRPDVLFLGRKDAQQAVILSQMVRDLDFELAVKVLPTVREDDGLAISSRNRYLSPSQRLRAAKLFDALMTAGRLFQSGLRDANELVKAALAPLQSDEQIEVEYLEARDAESLKPVQQVTERTLLALAARIGTARLIDNIVLDPATGLVER